MYLRRQGPSYLCAYKALFLKLRGFSRSDLLCIDIYCNTLLTNRLWFLKARGGTSGVPRSRKKTCSSGLNVLVCVNVFRAIWGIFDQGPCCEICWKSFISPVSPIVEQDYGCHKCLNGLKLQRNDRMRVREYEKPPKFEHFFC